ncbi:MAG: substrate-binding domain-containing protein [Terrimicrobiaceae bacterium]
MNGKTSSPLALPPPSRVAVLVDTASTWGRGIITGIHNYSRKQRGWQMFIESRGVEETLLVPRGWHGEGIIARIGTPEMARRLRLQKLPVVNVSGIHLPGVEFPRVTNDVGEVARMAVQYFWDRGYKNFAYLSLRGLEYVVRQRDAFVSATAAAGFDCAVHGIRSNSGSQAPDWNLKLDKLGRWLKSLPKPVGILTWSGGREVIHACEHVGLRVPEEVAILSGSEDELLCECSPIPISGVEAACEQIGYEAAALLDRLMRGKPAPKSPRVIPPLRVITRQSTDTTAISDRALIAALGFIRENAAQPLLVDEVAAHAGISRRVLERRFQKTLRRSPAEQIAQERLAHLKAILVETDLPIHDVAKRCGFGSPEYMTYVFRTELGTTPLRYRRDSRGR